MKKPRKKQPRQRLNFTKPVLEKIPAPPKRTYYHDTGQKGLILDVTPKGVKTFYLYRFIQGRPEKIKIGPFPDVSVEDARKAALRLLGQIASGKNPAEERRWVRGEMTLAQVWDLYLDQYARPRKKASSLAFDEWMWKKYLPNWKEKKLSSIRHRDLQKLNVETSKNHGPAAANNLLVLLRTLFEQARNWGFQGENPARGIPKFPLEKRERFLQPDEAPRFFKALAEERSEDLRDFVLIALLTAQRAGNVAAMRWRDLDLVGHVWRIPASEAKSGKQYSVPLVPEALEILLRRLQQRAKGEEWVLPGRKAGRHMRSPSSQFKTFLKRAEIDNFRIHDLRRSLASWQAALGANLAVIQKTLGHADISTTMIYARLNLDPVRASMEEAARALRAAGEKVEGAEVVKLPKGRR